MLLDKTVESLNLAAGTASPEYLSAVGSNISLSYPDATGSTVWTVAPAAPSSAPAVYLLGTTYGAGSPIYLTDNGVGGLTASTSDLGAASLWIFSNDGTGGPSCIQNANSFNYLAYDAVAAMAPVTSATADAWVLKISKGNANVQVVASTGGTRKYLSAIAANLGGISSVDVYWLVGGGQIWAVTQDYWANYFNFLVTSPQSGKSYLRLPASATQLDLTYGDVAASQWTVNAVAGTSAVTISQGSQYVTMAAGPYSPSSIPVSGAASSASSTQQWLLNPSNTFAGTWYLVSGCSSIALRMAGVNPINPNWQFTPISGSMNVYSIMETTTTKYLDSTTASAIDMVNSDTGNGFQWWYLVPGPGNYFYIQPFVVQSPSQLYLSKKPADDYTLLVPGDDATLCAEWTISNSPSPESTKQLAAGWIVLAVLMSVCCPCLCCLLCLCAFCRPHGSAPLAGPGTGPTSLDSAEEGKAQVPISGLPVAPLPAPPSEALRIRSNEKRIEVTEEEQYELTMLEAARQRNEILNQQSNTHPNAKVTNVTFDYVDEGGNCVSCF